MNTTGRDGAKAYEVVLQHIEAGILDATYRAGDRLPPERDLAAQLGVSRAAVREAMRVLQAQGLITATTGRGGGTHITPSRRDALAHILRLHLAVTGAEFSELTETRIALERASAAAAARAATPERIAPLRELVAAMAAAASVDAFTVIDTEFHVAIARCGQSDLIGDLTVAIRRALATPIRDAQVRMDDWPGFRTRLIAEHTAILDAIAAGDADRAVTEMNAHIRTSYTVLAASHRR
ncbi:FadR/GntR family transcriptional regulator [Propionicicella superfundia]|uniref:FadR/GntR family transcriptional regulator n=1 Tax=Propionicicella superfundia TaxID=348582 RepID=UPI0003FA3013|nr:FCD domain-containing protein [Propionicicella superfundia]